MKFTTFILLFISPLFILAQKTADIYQVNYTSYYNGEKESGQTKLYYQDQTVYLSKSDDQIQQYTDFENDRNISTIAYKGKIYGLLTPFNELPKATMNEDTEEILGYQCKHVSYSYFSNQVEVWYTEEAKAKGSPYSKFLPSKDALVLKITINANQEIRASSIKKVKDHTLINTYTKATINVSNSEFEEIKIKSKYQTLTVFKDEVINFDTSILPAQDSVLNANETYRFSNGTVILNKVKLTSELKNSGYVFAELNCKSNGDAYDRTGSVFILPAKSDSVTSMLQAFQYGIENLPVYTDNSGQTYQGIVKDEQYEPPVELMRFFTSFGADYFNTKREINNYNWADDVVYKQEVTSLIPLHKDEFWIGVYIGNYSEGGHKVSLELDFHPSFDEGDEETTKPYVQPLFSTVNIMEMSGQNYGRLFGNDSLTCSFSVPEDVQNLNLLFTSTGHGGWGGGDEFNPKLNRILIDGKEVFSVTPWRTDCATYRLSNPASGNFGNGLSSSDLSRSNWCPAILTPPYVISLASLEPGAHTLEVIIDQGEEEGSSFSHWQVSGVLIGHQPE